MSKRLTEKQKEEILNGFKAGVTVDILSQNIHALTLLLLGTLKKILGN